MNGLFAGLLAHGGAGGLVVELAVVGGLIALGLAVWVGSRREAAEYRAELQTAETRREVGQPGAGHSSSPDVGSVADSGPEPRGKNV